MTEPLQIQSSNKPGQLPPPLVFIVILHWRGLELTRACLESVRQLTYANKAILIVDNGSEMQETKALADSDSNFHQLYLDENRGFAGGCNAGINYALARQAQYIWLLNNDATVEPDSLSQLVSAANNNARAGALSALILDTVPDHDLDLAAIRARGVINYARGKAVLRPIGANIRSRKPASAAGAMQSNTREASGVLLTHNPNPPEHPSLPADISRPIKCDWLAGANLLLRSQAVHEVGGFDENYFLYFEDTELCERLRIAGWRCLLVPQARIIHKGSASTTGNLKHWRSYYYTRNRMLFFNTYLFGWRKIIAFFFIWAHILRHCLTLPCKGADGRSQLRAELLGANDFLAGNFGQATCLDWCN